MDQPPPLDPRAGRWTRFGAFLIDSALLGLIGLSLGSLEFDRFAHMGEAARLIGWAIATIYFTSLTGPSGEGKTLGQRALKIRTIDGEGNPPKLSPAFLRTIVLATPWVTSGAALQSDASARPGLIWVERLGLAAIAVIGLVDVYFFLFNRRTRQALHDRLARTFVVRTGPHVVLRPERMWPGHWLILACLGVSFALSPKLAQRALRSYIPAGVFQAQASVENLPGVVSASVFAGTNWQFARGVRSRTTYCTVVARLRSEPPDYEAAASKVAQAVLHAFPEAMKQDRLNVTIRYGYTIGIASGWRNRTFSHAPSEWQSAAPATLVNLEPHRLSRPSESELSHLPRDNFHLPAEAPTRYVLPLAAIGPRQLERQDSSVGRAED